ncbi:BamA/TamA family outer membrane protein, partial [Escherichia coli]|nr:BamA/TamA family outer membrane protein [Escherichia coli]
DGSFVGGTTYVNATAETQFPVPLIPESVGIRGAVFSDVATLFGSDNAYATNTDMQWRASVGAG